MEPVLVAESPARLRPEPQANASPPAAAPADPARAGGARAVAEQLLIAVAGAEARRWHEALDRHLLGAARAGLLPLIVLVRNEACDDRRACRLAIQPYRELELCALLLTLGQADGLTALRGALAGRVTEVVEASEAAAQLLLEALQPGLGRRVRGLSGRPAEAAAGPSARLWLRLGADGAQVGPSASALPVLRGDDLPLGFPEVAAAARGCGHSGCTHRQEPDCAVRRAVEGGTIAASRYRSYRVLRAELAG